MEFVKSISENEYNEFIENHELGHFLQSAEWGRFKSKYGWKHELVGIKEAGTIIGATMIMYRKLPLVSKRIAYSPRGIILDYNNKELLKFMLENIKKHTKSKGAIFYKIDPFIRYKERFLDGEYLSDGFDNTHIINELKNLGGKHKGLFLDFNGMQPRFSMWLDINKDISDVFKSFTSKFRYNIRLAEKKGVEVSEGTRGDLKEFQRIMKITGERDGFISRPLEYFENMYEELSKTGMIKLFLAKFNIEKRIKTIDEEIIASPDRKEKLLAEKKLLEAELKSNPNGITVSGTIAIKKAGKVCYLYGASDNKYRNIMPNHLIQWEMIKWAKEENSYLYDFRGISGDLNPANKLYGLYKFKKGFNPELVEYIGEFDFINNKIYYIIWEKLLPRFIKLRRRIYKVIKRK
ncbi:MAG: aminoacyltransferase [Clostridia bacterium]|jgi:peptidoglycan pentaglycine glycine transferase (the first glycine)|nr:aminoacyltransferase [Clostridia bacterium]